jgi:uncharacterized protein (TIGR02594 family)
MPPWMKIAYSYMNTKEVPGSGNNSVIIGWAKRLGGWFASFYTKDEIPWCGLFVGNCMKEAGFPVQPDALSALGWSDYERSCEPCLGAIMVFKRPGGGHVGFYVAEDDTAYHILGGNQGDKVSIARIDKARHVDTRWPKTFPMSKTGRVLKKSTAPLSRNEA